jgi:hypothetical protein
LCFDSIDFLVRPNAIVKAARVEAETIALENKKRVLVKTMGAGGMTPGYADGACGRTLVDRHKAVDAAPADSTIERMAL